MDEIPSVDLYEISRKWNNEIFSALEDPFKKHITPYLSLQETGRLCCTSYHMHGIFREPLKNVLVKHFSKIQQSLIDPILYNSSNNASYAAISHVEPAVIYTLVQLLGYIPDEMIAALTEALTKAISNKDSAKAVNIASTLVKLGKEPPEAIAAFIKALGDRDLHVRIQAISSLGECQQISNKTISALSKILMNDTNDKEEKIVKTKAASALGNLKQATPMVITALTTVSRDSDKFLKAHALFALIQLGKEPDNIINELIEILDMRTDQIRPQTESALMQLGKKSSEVIIRLITKLGHNSPFVRTKIVSTLVQLGQESTKVMEQLIIALQNSSSAIRAYSAAILVQLGYEPPEVVNELISSLGDKAFIANIGAVVGLEKLRRANDVVIAALLKALRHNSSILKVQIASSLIRFGHETPEVVEALLKACEGPTPEDKPIAASALKNLKKNSADTIVVLNRALKDKSPFIKTQAASALVRLGEESSEVIRVLIVSFTNNSIGNREEEFKNAAEDGLSNLKQAPPNVISILLKEAFWDTGYVRPNVVSILVKLGEKSSVIAALVDVLNKKSSSTDIRIDVACGLAQIGHESPEVINELITAFRKNSSPSIISILGNLKQLHPEIITTLITNLKNEKNTWLQAKSISLLVTIAKELNHKMGFYNPLIAEKDNEEDLWNSKSNEKMNAR